MVPRSADAQPLVARRHIAAQSDAGAGTVYLGVLKAPAGIDTRDLPLDARLILDRPSEKPERLIPTLKMRYWRNTIG